MKKLNIEAKTAMLVSFILLTVISSKILWYTRIEDLPSQSAFWDAPNKIWYILIHVGIIMAFFTLNAIYHKIRPLYFLTALMSLLTLGLNMFEFKSAHNVSTAGLLVAAVFSQVAYTKKPWLFGIIGIACVIFFITGLFEWYGPSSVFFVETVVEDVLAVMVLANYFKLDRTVPIKLV